MFVPVSRPILGEEEKKYVEEALKNGNISGTSGRFITEFEEKFSSYCGVKHGIATSNGTTALHLAVVALGIKNGDEVLVSTLTNMASVFSIIYTGATPVPIDIEEDTWNIDPALIEKSITPRTKAIMVVHVYGHPANMDPINEIAKKHGLFVIEDAAEAHGAEYKGKKTGSLGHVACFSFYANKIITTGEGGMVLANDHNLAEKVKALRSFAYGKEEKFMHEDIGFNYRMSNLQAAIGLGQFSRIDEVVKKKRELAQFYKESLEDISDLQLPVEKDYAKNVYWMYHLVLKGKLQNKRKEIMQKLKELGVETRESFVPANMQNVLIQKGLANKNECPIANYVGENGFYLPSSADLTEEERKYVVESLKKVIDQ